MCQVFYRAHIVSAAVFVIFGIIHWAGMLTVSITGLAVYGIDVAYRWFQTQQSVSLRLEASCSARIVSITIPLQPGIEYSDGCHVWVCFPELGWLEYHPFSVASSTADPLWRDCMLVHTKVYNRWTKVHTAPCCCVL